MWAKKKNRRLRARNAAKTSWRRRFEDLRALRPVSLCERNEEPTSSTFDGSSANSTPGGGVKTEDYLSLHIRYLNVKAPSRSFFRSDVNLLTAPSKVTPRRFTMSQRGSNYNLHKLTKSPPTTERASCSLTARRHSPAAVPPGSNGCILNVCHLRTISELKHPNGWLHFSLEVRRVCIMTIYLNLFSYTEHSKRVIKVKKDENIFVFSFKACFQCYYRSVYSRTYSTIL